MQDRLTRVKEHLRDAKSFKRVLTICSLISSAIITVVSGYYYFFHDDTMCCANSKKMIIVACSPDTV